MRDAARRVGAHLQRAHGYRGAFGIDGVLTADGFRPTELNTRMSAGATALSEVDRRFFTFLQAALVAGTDPGLTAADVEALVPAMDAARVGKVVAFAEGTAGRATRRATRSPGTAGAFARAEEETGNLFSIGSAPSGLFARVDPCTAVVPGRRLAPVNAALLRAPRRVVRHLVRADGARARRSYGGLTWPGWSSWAAGSEGSPPRSGWPSSATRSRCSSGWTRSAARCPRSPRTGSSGTPGRRRRCCPAVIRDLFRKSGRPVERELDLEPLDLVREHWFEDGTVLGLPGHSRAAQLRAFDELGPGLGRQWVDYVDSFGERLGGAAPRLLRERRGTPTTSPARWRSGSTAARCCTSG